MHYSVLFIAYVVVPSLDLILPTDEVNPTKDQEKVRIKIKSYHDCDSLRKNFLLWH
jgi:hypothetical protein